MFTATKDKALLTTTTGALPRPSWYTENLRGIQLSQGAGAGDIPQISEGAQRLARGLAAQLLSEDAAQHFAAMEAYADPELDGQEWTPAPALPPYDDVAAAATVA